MRKVLRVVLLAVLSLGIGTTIHSPIVYGEEIISQASKTKSILRYLQGDWYDRNGKLVARIKDNSINGDKIKKGLKPEFHGCFGSGIFLVIKDTGIQRIAFSYHIEKNEKDCLVLNNSVVLHRVPKPDYYESIAGIHLNMTPKEVKAVLGEPTAKGDLSAYFPKWTGWYYADQGIIIDFNVDAVDRIYLLEGSKAHFDRSGLTYNSSSKAFEKAYRHFGSKRYPFDRTKVDLVGRRLEKGEVLYFREWGYPKFIVLDTHDA